MAIFASTVALGVIFHGYSVSIALLELCVISVSVIVFSIRIYVGVAMTKCLASGVDNINTTVPKDGLLHRMVRNPRVVELACQSLFAQPRASRSLHRIRTPACLGIPSLLRASCVI